MKKFIFFYINFKSNIKHNPSKRIYNVIFDGKYNPEWSWVRLFLLPFIIVFFVLK